MKKLTLTIIFFTLLISFLPTINADVISINAGGSGNVVINPDEYIEGFFWCSPLACSDMGYNCDTWPNGCGVSINCGTCASGYTCTAGTCVAVVTPPVTPGGGGAPGVTPAVNIRVVPSEINIDMAINTVVERTITVTNLGTGSLSLSITQQDLDDLVILTESSLSLNIGETKSFTVRFAAPATPGVYTGKIIIGSIQIPVALNVKTKLLLFDSNIVVLNDDYKVPQGDKLKTQVTLVPLGDKERLDITLNYEIKDYDGNTYLTKSETLLIEDRVEFKRNFDTGMLPLKKYVIALELVYTGGVAPSSAHFEVTEKLPTDIFARLIFFLIIIILIIAIIILIILIIRRLRRKKGETTQ